MYTYYRPLRLSQAINRLFDESVVNPQLLNPEAAALRLDIVASGDEYVVSAAVPGLKAEDLSLEVLGDTVTIRGELPAPEVAEGAETLLHERRTGKFARTVTLPAELDGAKAEAAKPKSIKVLAK